MLDRSFEISEHLEQMPAHSIQPIVLSQPFVAIQRAQTFKTSLRSVHHCDRNCVVQCHHGTGRNALKQFVQRQNLRPVRIFRARRFVMNGGDRRLKLVESHGSFGKRERQAVPCLQ